MKRPSQSSDTSRGEDSRGEDLGTFDLTDPRSYRPHAMSRHAAELWPLAAMQGWMTKHMPPAFSFTKTRKRRYVLLIDRMIYTFKTDKPTHDYKEFYELTKNTNVFATDQFPGVLYCLEIQRTEDGRTWYLQADDAEAMKVWLSVIKKTIQWLKNNSNNDQQRSPDNAVVNLKSKDVNCHRASIISIASQEEDNAMLKSPPSSFSEYSVQESVSYLEYISRSPSAMDDPPPVQYHHQRYHPHHHQHQQQQQQRRWPSRLPSVLPPQLPPPTSSLPPLPTASRCTYY